MFSNKVFQIALLASIITHGVILFQNINLPSFSTKQKEEKLEIRYIEQPKKPKEAPKPIRPKKELLSVKRPPPPFIDIDKENTFKKDKKVGLPDSAPLIKPAFTKPDIIEIKKEITLPPVDIDKIKNTSYLSYYQIVREKIKRTAYQNYTRTEVGEVYLTFVISKDGYLRDIRLIEDKSSSNPFLRDIALRSIKQASPFPNFPKELDYLQLSFNVIISFEIE